MLTLFIIGETVALASLLFAVHMGLQIKGESK